jgi:hypothetical protein
MPSQVFDTNLHVLALPAAKFRRSPTHRVSNIPAGKSVTQIVLIATGGSSALIGV